MAIPKFKPLADMSQDTKNKVKPILIGAIALLLGAFGLTASGTDLNLNKLFTGSSVQDSIIRPTQKPGTSTSSTAGIVEQIMNIKRDAQGKFLPENCSKNVYNCKDFKYHEDAQEFFDNCGGAGKDVNRLDGDKNGVACQDLPNRPK